MQCRELQRDDHETTESQSRHGILHCRQHLRRPLVRPPPRGLRPPHQSRLPRPPPAMSTEAFLSAVVVTEDASTADEVVAEAASPEDEVMAEAMSTADEDRGQGRVRGGQGRGREALAVNEAVAKAASTADEVVAEAASTSPADEAVAKVAFCGRSRGIICRRPCPLRRSPPRPPPWPRRQCPVPPTPCGLIRSNFYGHRRLPPQPLPLPRPVPATSTEALFSAAVPASAAAGCITPSPHGLFRSRAWLCPRPRSRHPPRAVASCQTVSARKTRLTNQDRGGAAPTSTR